MATVHGSRLIFLFEATLFSALLLVPARPASAADGSAYPAGDCPYPCLPPPAVTANCPPPPPAAASYSYPPPPGAYIPYFQPAAGGGGGGGSGGYGGYPAPPPPNPILPWYPWYYKTPPSSAAATSGRGSRVLLGSAVMVAAALLIMA
jgi:hypothetical protein